MMKDLIPLNLQFFAEGEEAPEAAEPGTEEGTVTTETETAEESGSGEPQGQSDEMNRIYADARRRAEAEAERKFSQKQAQLDRMYAERFKGLVNPETNQPITNANEYLDALAAQERMQAREQVKQAGIDPEVLDRMINNSPVVQQAARAMEEGQQAKAQQMIQEDFQAIVNMDPTITSVADVEKAQGFNDACAYASRTGVRLSDAYKIVNFDRLSAVRSNAAAQGAINQAKSKEHLATADGVANKDNLREIPEGSIRTWRSWFPDKSDAELKALYNKVK